MLTHEFSKIVSISLLACLIVLFFDSTVESEGIKEVPSQIAKDDRAGRDKGYDFSGKIRLPADVSIDMVEPIQAAAPITIVVSASSKVPARSGMIMLMVPSIGDDQSREEILWSGNPSDFVSEIVEFTIEALPEGQYRLIAIFRFIPDRAKAKELALSRSLYVDVRPDAILSSNISFTHIKRLELRKELEERVVVDLLKERKQPATPDIVGQKQLVDQ